MHTRSLAVILFVLLASMASAQTKKLPPPVPQSKTTRLTPEELWVRSLKLKDDTAKVKFIDPKWDTIRYTPATYYLADVIDETGTNDSIGYTNQPKSGKPQQLSLLNGTKGYFINSLNKKIAKDTTLYPVIMIVKELSITDERIKNLGDHTRIKYAFEFASVHKNDTIRISNYSGGGSFRTPLNEKKNYDSIWNQLKEGTWEHIDENMKEASENLMAFCKGVKMNTFIRVYPKTSDSIFYDGNRQIDWDDYRGEAEAADGLFSYFFIDYGVDIDFRKSYLHINAQLATTFVKSASWVNGAYQKSEVLEHEKHKFRLVHAYMLKFKKQLDTFAFTIDNYKTELPALYKKMNKEINAELAAYDKETNFGLRKKDQMRWQDEIDRLLNENK